MTDVFPRVAGERGLGSQYRIGIQLCAAPVRVVVDLWAEIDRQALDAGVRACAGDVEVAVATPARTVPLPPPSGLVVGRDRMALRCDAIAVACVLEALPIDADFAANEGDVTSFHLAANDEQIAVDARARTQHDVGVDREHASFDATADVYGAIEHRDVSVDDAVLLDFDSTGRPQRGRLVVQARRFASDVSRQAASLRSDIPILRNGRRSTPGGGQRNCQTTHAFSWKSVPEPAFGTRCTAMPSETEPETTTRSEEHTSELQS